MRPALPSPSRNYALLTALAALASLGSFWYFFRSGEFILYGDAEAHLNIARRVVDSLTPGPKQLGTVWLPLPHLLTIPFVWFDSAWKSGWAGSVPSMLAYVAGVLGIFRLVRSLASDAAAYVAAAIYGANPNLLYLQSTAMTEPLFLAAMIWMVAGLVEVGLCFRRLDPDAAKWPLLGCGIASAAGSLTRYEGWFAGFFVGLIALRLYFWLDAQHRARLRNHFLAAGFLMAVAPVGWLAYNWSVYGNPLEFATGPYSARAIAEKTTRAGDPHHPGYHSVTTATIYFVKSAKMNLGAGAAEGALFWTGALGAVLAFALQPRRRIALLLWTVLPFYALSIAYGGVPIFLPAWWPFSHYNVRYGLEMLPAVAISVAFLFDSALGLKYKPVLERTVNVVAILLIAVSYGLVWKAGPVALWEARVNGASKAAFEELLSEELARLPHGTRLLMYSGTHAGALRRAGVSLSHTVNENNYLMWDAALASPATESDFVIAVTGDPVAEAVSKHPEGLAPVGILRQAAMPEVTMYRSLSRTPRQ